MCLHIFFTYEVIDKNLISHRIISQSDIFPILIDLQGGCMTVVPKSLQQYNREKSCLQILSNCCDDSFISIRILKKITIKKN